jgi:hypothetical protein
MSISLGSNLSLKSVSKQKTFIRPDSDLKSFKLTVDPFLVIKY